MNPHSGACCSMLGAAQPSPRSLLLSAIAVIAPRRAASGVQAPARSAVPATALQRPAALLDGRGIRAERSPPRCAAEQVGRTAAAVHPARSPPRPAACSIGLITALRR